MVERYRLEYSGLYLDHEGDLVDYDQYAELAAALELVHAQWLLFVDPERDDIAKAVNDIAVTALSKASE